MAPIRKQCVPVHLLRELIDYDPITGQLRWLPRQPKHFRTTKLLAERIAATWNKRYAGTPALAAVERERYLHGDIFGLRYKAHRVAWALYYGKWPARFIDHINGDRADNRISNLRVVSHQENAKNQRLSSASSSGVTGVSWASHRNKWTAQIKVHGIKHHLGMFDSIDDAAAARKAADQRFDFHPNHGRATV